MAAARPQRAKSWIAGGNFSAPHNGNNTCGIAARSVTIMSMRAEDCATIALMLVDACDETETAAGEFFEQHGSPWIRNARVAYRQSVLAARLREHPTLGVDESGGIEGGRIKVTGIGESPMLLKPLSSLISPPGGGATVAPPHFPGMEPPAGEPLLAYKLEDRTVTLYEGACRQVDIRGRAEFEVVGELRPVWNGDGIAGFDQGAESGWTDDLFGDSAGEEGVEL